jgi:putative transposase
MANWRWMDEHQGYCGRVPPFALGSSRTGPFTQGITVRSYCAETGIHENTYFYWQHKLREAASAQAAGLPAPNTPAPRGWTALSVRADSADTNGVVVEMGGCRVHVEADTDTTLLVRVCQALKTL